MSFSHFRVPMLHALTLSLCALAVLPSQAADPAKRTKSFGKAGATGPLLSRDELRTCMATRERIRATNDDMLKQKAQLEQEKQALQASGEELKEKLVWVDRTVQEQVDAFNMQASERDKRLNEYQARSDSFNKQVDALNADRQTFATQCENRRYDEADELLIKAGK